MSSFEHATFGNRGGSHQLLETSLVGCESLLEELRFLVDRPVGHVGPEVVWSPYWGCGPLGDWWALWRGEEDISAPRKNMVKSRVAIVRDTDVGSMQNLEELFRFLAYLPAANQGLPVVTVVETLTRGVRPVVVPGISLAPELLQALWPRLWPAARLRFALRTLFGSETLESGVMPDVVVIPTELRPRWPANVLVDGDHEKTVPNAASWFSGSGPPGLERLLQANWHRLPGEFTVITRLERIAGSIQALQEGRSGFADALLIVRTVEAFDGGFELPEEDISLLVTHLSDMKNAKITDIRAASLAELALVGDCLSSVKEAAARWIQHNLALESNEDALWILEQQAGDSHVSWWLRAVREGLVNAFQHMTSDWANAIWRWWTVNAAAIDWTQNLIPADSVTETTLLVHLPSQITRELDPALRTLCAKRQWAKLLAGALRLSKPLDEGLKVMRATFSLPESGLDILLEQTDPLEVVAAAAESGWQPLIERAVHRTTHDAALFDGIDGAAPSLLQLLAAHLQAGGDPPSALDNHDFTTRLFDGCVDGDNFCLDIAQYLDARAAQAALCYSRQDEFWNALRAERFGPFLSATARFWLNLFVAGGEVTRPSSPLAAAVRHLGRSFLSGRSIARLHDYLSIFPEVSEREFVDWLESEGFSWGEGDIERFGDLLLARGWSVAAKRFRMSWKTELQGVAWHARELLSRWDQIRWFPPSAVTTRFRGTTGRGTRRSTKMKILFLASNPTSSERLALDEEARSIEDKVRAARLRDEIEFRTKWAVRPADLQQILLEEDPTVVHFSGHGGGPFGLVLHSDVEGDDSAVSSAALADLFRVLKDRIRIVVLNACYSKEQAEAIVEEIDFVVGMADSIGDEGARVFAAAFYRGLAFGKTVQTAFDLGLNELGLLALTGDQDVPVLLTRDDVDAESVSLMDTNTF